jgi:CubicO group peptidase (beta-lactamase class C family)
MKDFNFTRMALLLVLALGFACTVPEKDSPELEGISSRAILDFVEALDYEMPDQIHSIMLRRHGKVAAQGWWAPYKAEDPHMLYSLSKSFTSTAIGMAVDEGLISLNDPIISFFPEETPAEPGAYLKAMRIRDLLRMNTGHQWEPQRGQAEGSWVKGFLAAEVQFKPGTHFVYNSYATYMLSAIIQKVSGSTLLDYLTPRLFEPLGIKNPSWETDPAGINTGGWGLNITTEDISKFGQLYLQKGMWNGKQLVSEAWVEEATSLQSSNGSNPDSDWDQGYGYQFWRCRFGLYRGDGAFGQYCIVMPKQDAVLAITSGTGDMQKVMDLAWKFLLPAMEESSLSPDEEGRDLLEKKLNSLAIAFAKGEKESSEAAELIGKRYDIKTEGSKIVSVSFDFSASPNIITIFSEDGISTLNTEYLSWGKGALKNPRFEPDEVAVSGAWESPDSYLMKLVYYKTPYVAEYRFKFKENLLTLERDLNVSFGPTELLTLKGVRAD